MGDLSRLKAIQDNIHIFLMRTATAEYLVPKKLLAMRKMTIIIWIFSGFILAGCQGGKGLVLSRNGIAKATIILPEHPDEWEQRAADALRSYLKKIGGADIAVEQAATEKSNIYIGQNRKPDMAEPAIAYWVAGRDLYISGGSSQACLHAVYTFLEREFGCRFYSPDVEKVPAQNDIVIMKDLHYQYSPPVTVRTVHSRLFYDNPEFARKLRVSEEAFPTYVPEARVHTFHRFVPADTYYGAHPEYFALRNGRRLPTQLCLTNETVVGIVKNQVADYLARSPGAKVISVSQDDNTQYCQCERCEEIHRAEGSPAGSMIHFVNRIAEQFPDKQISTLAYQYTRKAPTNIRPRSNVLITLCSIECDRSAPIDERCRDFTADLQAWSKISDNIRIWDYTTQFTNFLAPFPNMHTLQPNIDLFRTNNAKWIFEQHSYQPSELFELRSYLTAQLLWQPDADPTVIMNDFLHGYYEAAAPFVKSYIETVHEEMQRDSSFFLFLYGDPAQGFASFLSEPLLSYYDSLYDEAARAVSGQEDLESRLDAARLSVDYALLEYAKTDLSRAVLSPDLTKRLDRFAATTQEEDITMMNEMRYTVAEYIDGYQRTIARAKKKNLAFGKKVMLKTRPKKYAKEDPQTLTDGAFGGGNFYANWLGFEGNDLEAVIDLEEPKVITEVSSAFLQVTNHIVFFPLSVEYWYSMDGQNYQLFAALQNQRPLTKISKTNDIQYFTSRAKPVHARYLKIIGRNQEVAPVWHHAADLPAWIFVDEVMVR